MGILIISDILEVNMLLVYPDILLATKENGYRQKKLCQRERGEVLSSPTVQKVIRKVLTNHKTVLKIPRLQWSIVFYLLSDSWSIQIKI